jgi:hypothetical protein
MLKKLTFQNVKRGLRDPKRAIRYFRKQLRSPGTKRPVYPSKIAGNFYSKEHSTVVYFAGNVRQWYQIETWFKPLEELHKHTPVLFVVRSRKVFEKLVGKTEFLTCLCITIDDVMGLYETSLFKVILYVNHGAKNFQSLIDNNVLHIHINHGESDKLSTITNQSKAYDYVFLAGKAAYKRYEDNLLKNDMNRYKVIGRPQLEHYEPLDREKILFELEERRNSGATEPDNLDIKMDDIAKKMILYAPTWEGTHLSMNYSSIPFFGIELITELLKWPDCVVIYKPHPHTGSRDEATQKAHQKIIELINNSENGIYFNNGEILGLFPHVECAIFDNSTVAVDFLRFDKPMIMSEFYDRIDDRIEKPKIMKAAKIINIHDIGDIRKIIDDVIDLDVLREARAEVKDFYLGNLNYSLGESTSKFIEEVLRASVERDELVKARTEFTNDREQNNG